MLNKSKVRNAASNLTNTFSSTAHVNHLLTIGNQRLFLLSQFKKIALACKAKRRGLAKTIPSMLEIIQDHDESLFKRIAGPFTLFTPFTTPSTA